MDALCFGLGANVRDWVGERGGGVRLFEFEEGVVGWTAVFVVFSVADDGCVASFYEFVCDVFAAEGYSCGIAGFKTFGGRFRVIELYVNLLLTSSEKKILFCQ